MNLERFSTLSTFSPFRLEVMSVFTPQPTPDIPHKPYHPFIPEIPGVPERIPEKGPGYGWPKKPTPPSPRRRVPGIMPN